ncbi:hypothetical protein D915_005215 [Fasciola hepatica]|uniref:Uncharacterized protein n=1 Tax=Fasciola hepatica TaxID=6192 RepID=A0A4E0R5N5_FASHE|nr:hypothetical protein D915_005215 [Fasciola hepatica]
MSITRFAHWTTVEGDQSLPMTEFTIPDSSRSQPRLRSANRALKAATGTAESIRVTLFLLASAETQQDSLISPTKTSKRRRCFDHFAEPSIHGSPNSIVASRPRERRPVQLFQLEPQQSLASKQCQEHTQKGRIKSGNGASAGSASAVVPDSDDISDAVYIVRHSKMETEETCRERRSRQHTTEQKFKPLCELREQTSWEKRQPRSRVDCLAY